MPFSIQTTQSAASGSTGMKVLYDLNLEESAGATAQVQLKDASGGNIKKTWNLAANESVEITWAWGLKALDPTLTWYINIVSGAVNWNAGGQQEGGR